MSLSTDLLEVLNSVGLPLGIAVVGVVISTRFGTTMTACFGPTHIEGRGLRRSDLAPLPASGVL